MFLRGVFIDKPYTSVSALEQVRDIFSGEKLPKVVAEFVPEVFLQMNKGAEFDNLVDVTRYSFGIRRNEEISNFNRKIKRKEYNFYERDDMETSLPFMTVDANAISDESLFKAQENISWVSLISHHTLTSFDFKNEIIDYIERYNDWSDYFYNVYATNLKILIERSVAGVSASREFLDKIIKSEGNEDLEDVLTFLMRYIEFKEFLTSDDVKLTLRLGS